MSSADTVKPHLTNTRKLWANDYF